jgi:DNA-binding CsgD family transcriptional regulator
VTVLTQDLIGLVQFLSGHQASLSHGQCTLKLINHLGVIKLTLISTEVASEFQAVELLLDSILKSDTASEFCRSIVHSGITGQSVQGCHIYLLDNASLLNTVAGYGIGYETEKAEISAWDDTPLSIAVRTKTYSFKSPSQGEQPLVAIPLLRYSVPVGCLGLVLKDGADELPFPEKLIPILSKLGTYCLANRNLSSSENYREANGEDLTSRQLQILGLMADGLVNAEIAANMMLSESTIRQETVRIYRALGVPNRSEASKKGRALGLIPQNRLTPQDR